MKFFLFLALFSSIAQALPGPEEAARILGSDKASERDQLTTELWSSGRNALTLLNELAESNDPEVSQRAIFIFRRLRMGLQPDSPSELLSLAENCEVAIPKERAYHLDALLEHPLGVSVALAFLDLWSTEQPLNPVIYRSWGKIVADALIEQRSYWKDFLTQPLTVRCRNVLITALDDLNMPMKHLMIEKLASGETRAIFEIFKTEEVELNSASYENLARAALISGDTETALDILFAALPSTKEDHIARRIAFLEKILELPTQTSKGPWSAELKMLRLRASENYEALAQFKQMESPTSLLAYESSLFLGNIAIPSEELPVDDLARRLALSTAQFFAEPPLEPDIEDLASTITNESGRLARGLLALGHPREAAQILADRHQPEFAVRTLWMTGHRQDARGIADNVMLNGDFKARISMRLTFIQLLGIAGLENEARALFTPLFEEEIKFDHLRRDAVRLALLLFSREKALQLVPEISGESPYRRQIAISALLPFPPKVAIFCYEEISQSEPDLQPSQILAKVEQHLSQDRKILLRHYQSELRDIQKTSIKSTDPIFQLAVFLKAPGALAMLKTSAWNRLSTDELESMVIDETWELASRKSALATALEISPGSATIRHLDLLLNQRGSPGSIALLTMGECSEVSRLARLSPDTPALPLTAQLADLNQPSSILCLHLASEKASPPNAIRFFQAALHGELVLGTQPATPYGQLMSSFQNYCDSRISEARSPGSQKTWEARKAAASNK